MRAVCQDQANVLRTIGTELHKHLDQVRSKESTLGTKPRFISPGAEEAHEARTF